MIPLTKLFRFGTATDRFFLFLASLATIGAGASTPVLTFIIGNATDEYSSPQLKTLAERLLNVLIQFASAGFASMLVFFLSRMFFKFASYSIGKRLRTRYFEALLRHEMGWNDINKVNEIATRVEVECSQVVTAIEEKMFLLFMSLSSVASGFAIGFIRGWQLSLICIGFLPFFAASYLVAIKHLIAEFIGKAMLYPQAGVLVTQALGAIKTVVGLGGEEKEVKQYVKVLEDLKKIIKKTAFKSGFSFGLNQCLNFLLYALAFFVGSRFLYNGTMNTEGKPYTAGDILTIFFSVVTGGLTFSLLAPTIQELTGARITAYKIYEIIDRNSKIDPLSSEGKSPQGFTARIVLKDVKFNYPAKPDIEVLKGVNLVFEPGQRTALVGESGCGKSTCMQMIERFYDPDSGSVSLDNIDLKELNVKWLRQNISYVG